VELKIRNCSFEVVAALKLKILMQIKLKIP
jgi:hypothetical protein